MWSLNGLRGTPVPKAAGQDTPNVSDKFPSSPALVESCALKICCRSSRVSWTLAMQMIVGSLTGLNGEVAQQNAVVGISPARVWWQTFVIRGARAVISLWRKTGPASNSSAKKRVSGVTGRNGPNVQKPVVEEPPGGTGS